MFDKTFRRREYTTDDRSDLEKIGADMSKVKLPGWEGPVLNAARWFREHYNIPGYEDIEDRFRQHFGCEIEKVMMDPPYQDFPSKTYAVFDEKAATLFILKWS